MKGHHVAVRDGDRGRLSGVALTRATAVINAFGHGSDATGGPGYIPRQAGCDAIFYPGAMQ
jgi:hypothetical protein